MKVRAIISCMLTAEYEINTDDLKSNNVATFQEVLELDLAQFQEDPTIFFEIADLPQAKSQHAFEGTII